MLWPKLLRISRQILSEDWNSFQRQRELPFMRQEKWLRKPGSFAPHMDEDRWSKLNLYHVTTNLFGVKSARKLKSRSALPNTTPGLGGGRSNEAPDMISVTYDYDRAVSIYHDLKYMCAVVSGTVSASDILDNLTSDVYEFPRELEEFLGIEEDEEVDDIRLNKLIKTPEQKYDFFVKVQDILVEDHIQQDDYGGIPWTGFTMPFERMRNLRENQIAILQLVAKEGAETEEVYQEKEIRFRPEDLRVIRYIQP